MSAVITLNLKIALENNPTFLPTEHSAVTDSSDKNINMNDYGVQNYSVTARDLQQYGLSVETAPEETRLQAPTENREGRRDVPWQTVPDMSTSDWKGAIADG